LPPGQPGVAGRDEASAHAPFVAGQATAGEVARVDGGGAGLSQALSLTAPG
jgi:hypothetical protein